MSTIRTICQRPVNLRGGRGGLLGSFIMNYYQCYDYHFCQWHALFPLLLRGASCRFVLEAYGIVSSCMGNGNRNVIWSPSLQLIRKGAWMEIFFLPGFCEGSRRPGTGA